MSSALVVAFAAVAVADWVAVARGDRRLEYFAKPGAMVVLIAVALSLDGVDDAVLVALVAAIAFSLGGDVALMLPAAREPAGPNLFAAGLGSFLLAHVAYVVAFAVDGVDAGWLAAGAAAALAVLVLVARPVVGAVRASDEPALAGPVTAYTLVIATMVMFAFGSGDGLAIAGATLFATSDSLIARERFIQTAPWGRLAIIVTYHVAQALLVLSFA